MVDYVFGLLDCSGSTAFLPLLLSPQVSVGSQVLPGVGSAVLGSLVVSGLVILT
jgi:hypothetical protein